MLGAGDQVAGARIIAEPGPRFHDLLWIGGGERRDVRPAREEVAEIRLDRLDGGLLQHDLGEPDA